jgi:tetratricopeptide (TPR) repeat protein
VTLFAEIAEEKAAGLQRARRDTAAAYRNLGAIASVRDPERALDAYRKALELDADDPETLLWVGWLSLERGFLNRAELSFRRISPPEEGHPDAR